MNKSELIIALRNEAATIVEAATSEAKKLNDAADILEGVRATPAENEAKETRVYKPHDSGAKDQFAQAADILSREGRFMHKNELAKVWGIKNISSVLSTAVRKGKHNLVNFTVGTSKNNIVWGFKDWLIDERIRSGSPKNIKPAYMFRQEALRYKVD